MKITRVLLALVLASAGTAFAQQWTKCASQDGYCYVNGSAVVSYGAGQNWAKRNVSGGILCSHNIFGDPAVGVNKSCYVESHASTGMSGNPPKWVACAKDYSDCQFRGTRPVSYGSGNKWLYRVASNGIKCVPESFGRDPAPGVQKTCYYDSANWRQ